ncbi:MAG: Uma2 family endonuclease [Cocleimonas sp.]|nr:Uma2 family endonuclease [Cocleimonas sp.]
MHQALAKQDYITPEEYLEGEPLAEVKHEYIDGEVYAMAGASDAHTKVALNIALQLKPHLRGSGCSTYLSDMKVSVNNDEAYFYPDVMVTCEPSDQQPECNYIKRSPKLIIEVLSPSTEGKDRGRKFILYRQIPSLEEYILINPRRYYLEQYLRRKDSDEWVLHSHTGEKAMIHFRSIDLTCSMLDLYEDVMFEADNFAHE